MTGMKKALTLLLVLTLLLALLAGCAGGKTPAVSAEPSAQPSAAPSAPADGVPSTRTAHALPLTTGGETLTMWYPTSITTVLDLYPDMAELPVYKELQKRTGVTLECSYINTSSAATNYSVLLASDTLPDIVNGAQLYHPQSLASAVADGYFVNVNEHLDCVPNYNYLIHSFSDADLQRAYAEKGVIAGLYTIKEHTLVDVGLAARADWLEELNIDPASLTTYDALGEALAAVKTKYDVAPLIIPYGIDASVCNFSAGFDTLANYNPGGAYSTALYVRDGKVTLAYNTDECRDYLELMSRWFTEGLIYPDYANFAGFGAPGFHDLFLAGDCGFGLMMAELMNQYTANNADPNARFVALPKTLKTQGQTLHLGVNALRVGGSGAGFFSVSAKCANVELALRWLDYRYSEDGAFLMNFGIEGEAHTKTADGGIRFTDLIVKNETASITEALTIYCANQGDGFYLDNKRTYYYADGAKSLDTVNLWSDFDYDGAYAFPASLTLSDEAAAEFSGIFADIWTFIGENYYAFYSAEKPIGEWADYVKQLEDMGWRDALAIYQTAYDAWAA